jgi:hypothetical protein
MKVYEKSSFIACSIEDLYAFHLDVANLVRITPPNMKVTLLNKESFTPKEGANLFIRSQQGLFVSFWEVKIKKMHAPDIIVDKALKSPFKHFEHFHMFNDLGDGMCELRDRVEYKLPLGWLGNLFDFIVRAQFDGMFTYRHEATKAILEHNK